jgi:hypothetical protein
MNDEQEERRRQRNKRIISWVIVILMVLSVAGFYVGSADTTSVKYNGIKFTPTSRGVLAVIDGNRYAFNYLPTQVEDIPRDPQLKQLLDKPVLAVTYDPASNYTDVLGAVQYYFQINYATQFDTFVQPGITTNTTFAFPLVTCANATATQPVLAFLEDNETRIIVDNNCIRAIGARGEDFLRMTDALILTKLGVLQ